MKERVFLLVKPDGMEREGEIAAILEPHVTVAATRKFARAPMKRIATLYAEHLGKPFHPWLMESFRGKPVKALLLERKPIVPRGSLHQIIADLVGDTNPRMAAPGTIRALSRDDMSVSMRQKRAVRNLVHRGRTLSESALEAALFFFDRPAGGGSAFEVGPFVLDFINPFKPESGGDLARGIFFEERLTELLRRMKIIPPGARVCGYRESVGRSRGSDAEGSLVMHVDFLHGGARGHRDIEILD